MITDGRKIDRRGFIKVSLVAGAGLVVACQMPMRGAAASRIDANPQGTEFVPNAWIQIAADDTVTVMIKHTELGQGTTTGLSMIVAEELEVDWSKMRPVIAPVAPDYKNPDFGVMATGGSTGIKTSWDTLRLAGATTRELLIAAAAATWNVPAAECRAENSTVVHVGSSQRLRFGELLDKAATLKPPQEPVLKKPEQFKYIGRPLARLDTADKARGKTVYGIDIKMPGLLTAAVAHAPLLEGRLVAVDDRKALSMPGVRNVLTLAACVAVVAETYWQAKNALDAVEARWEGGHPNLSSESIMARFAGQLQDKGIRVRDDGRVDQVIKDAAQRIRAVYELPYQAHICPEPMNCTADVQPDRCDIWAPTQSQEVARDLAARITGLPPEAVFVHTPFVGGGFGRRGLNDYVDQAVRISKAVKAPVKVIWSREEDMHNDAFRPASYNELEAGLDKNGYPIAWVHKAVGQSEIDSLIEASAPSIMPQWLPSMVKHPVAALITPMARRFMSPESAMSGSFDMAYAIDHVRVEYIRGHAPVPVASWRSVGDSRNAFVKESFMDEIAAVSGLDPVDLRLHLLKDAPQERGVLERAAAEAGWGKRLPQGLFQGVALHTFHGTPVAMVAEISMEKNNQVRVRRMVCAVDCGIAINPNLVRAQITGGVVFGLTATLKSKIQIKNGRIEQHNVDDFPILGYHEMPQVEVHIVKSTAPPMGIGEPGVPPVAPAVTNAIFKATGKRVRRLPVNRGLL